MEILPDVRYGSLSFITLNPQMRWTIQGPLSPDLLAGLIFGLKIVLDILVEQHNTQLQGRVEITTMNDKLLHSAQFTQLGSLIHSYRRMIAGRGAILANFERGENRTTDDKYGWWITEYPPKVHSFIEFETAGFVQGFISMLNAFQLDFRDFIFGPPYKFRTQDLMPIAYEIKGYDIKMPV